MRRRIAVCLLIALFVSAAAAARESRLADAGGSCSVAPRPAASRVVDRANANPVPAGKSKSTTPAGGSDESDAPRLQSPRWHRFLPGMFR